MEKSCFFFFWYFKTVHFWGFPLTKRNDNDHHHNWAVPTIPVRPHPNRPLLSSPSSYRLSYHFDSIQIYSHIAGFKPERTSLHGWIIKLTIAIIWKTNKYIRRVRGVCTIRMNLKKRKKEKKKSKKKRIKHNKSGKDMGSFSKYLIEYMYCFNCFILVYPS